MPTSGDLLPGPGNYWPAFGSLPRQSREQFAPIADERPFDEVSFGRSSLFLSFVPMIWYSALFSIYQLRVVNEASRGGILVIDAAPSWAMTT